MANTIVKVPVPEVGTYTLELYGKGADTLLNSDGADTLTRLTNNKRWATATVTEAVTGVNLARVRNAANDGVGYFFTESMADDTNTYLCVEVDPTTVDAVNTAVAARLDAAISSRMATFAQPAGFLAATFPSSVASPTNITAGTITTVSGNVNGTVASVGNIPIDGTLMVTLADGVTHGGTTAKVRLGSSNATPAFYATNSSIDPDSHAVHFQGTGIGGGAGLLVGGGGVIPAFMAAASQGFYGGSNSLASCVTATGFSTQTSVNTANDRLGFVLSSLTGACANPQAAAASTIITIGADTYQVVHAGLDATGVRTAPTLNKT